MTSSILDRKSKQSKITKSPQIKKKGKSQLEKLKVGLGVLPKDEARFQIQLLQIEHEQKIKDGVKKNFSKKFNRQFLEPVTLMEKDNNGIKDYSKETHSNIMAYVEGNYEENKDQVFEHGYTNLISSEKR